MAPTLTKYAKRRLEARNERWPDAEEVIYHRKAEPGFTTVPRTIALIGVLVKILAEKGKNDPSRAYLELWCRQRDDAFVEIIDPDELALASGFYRASRGRRVRSFHEALDQLQTLGFVRISSFSVRQYGYVLILHPHDIVQQLHAEGRVPDWWWDLFILRLREIGTELRIRPAAEGESAT